MTGWQRAGIALAMLSWMTVGCATKPVEVTLVEELMARGVAAAQTERGVTIYLPEVLFAFDESNLSESGRATLDDVARILRETAPDRELAVEGHTDAIGDESYNLDLSIRRASTVAGILHGSGMAENQITVLGLGETQPAASNDDRSGRELNRRVEIVVMHSGVAAGPPPRD